MPTPSKRFVSKNDAKAITQEIAESYATKTELSTHTSDSSVHMTSAEKSKLSGITVSSVSVAQGPTSGESVGTVTVNGTATQLYCDVLGAIENIRWCDLSRGTALHTQEDVPEEGE